MRKTQGKCTFQALLLWEKSVNLCSPILFAPKPDEKRCFNSIPGPKKEPILKMDKSKYVGGCLLFFTSLTRLEYSALAWDLRTATCRPWEGS